MKEPYALRNAEALIGQSRYVTIRLSLCLWRYPATLNRQTTIYLFGSVATPVTPLVCYVRVSTQRQGASGLGLEAQVGAVERYATQVSQPIIATFTEIESGTVKDRPELAKALALCRQRKAVLLIARLDRLSRSLAFVAQLLDANVEIRAADMPEANRMMLQMLAVFAEHERTLISERTKAALAAAKARGVVLGANGKKLAALNQAKARARAETYRPLLMEGERAGCFTKAALAKWLNGRGVSYEGSRWYPATVERVLKRLGDNDHDVRLAVL